MYRQSVRLLKMVLHTDEYLHTAESLGTGLSKAWFQDTVAFGETYKNIMTTVKDTSISSTCNQIVTTFLQSLCAFSDNTEKSKDQCSHRTTL